MKGEFIARGHLESNTQIGLEPVGIRALNSVMHDPSYTQKILLQEESFLVAYTIYPEYPITAYEDDHFWVCIEGKIYGQNESNIRREVYNLLCNIFSMDEYGGKDQIADKWLSKIDGEFIIYALNKKNREFVILNDILGRLPLYYFADESRLIISREISLITYLVSDDNDNVDNSSASKCLFDKMAIAQYLLFGYTLDKRTLLKDIFRLQPGTLIRIRNNDKLLNSSKNIEEDHFKIENLFTFNFDQKKYADESVKENTDKILGLLTEACKNRADPNGNNIISLSGGFDSRVVGACFYANKIPCVSVTYTEPNWKPILGNRSELDVAKEISNSFGFEGKVYGMMRERARDFLTLLNIKGGSNYLGLSFMLPILEDLKKKYSSASVFFTGDGGCRVLTNLIPPRKTKNTEELANYILVRLVFPSLSDVSETAQTSAEEILEELREILDSYPEKEMDKKYVHFIIYGSVVKQLFETEDRNRLYLWSTSPFYSIPLFKYVMNCSDNNKSSRTLHREILSAFSPSVVAIDNADYGSPVTSYKFKILFPIMRTIIFRYSILKRIARQIINYKNDLSFDCKMLRCISEQVESCEYLHKYFSVEKLNETIKDPTKHGFYTIYNLFTVISLIELIHMKDSLIKKYFE